METLNIILDIDDTLMPCATVAAQMVREKYLYDIRDEDITVWNFTNFAPEVQQAIFSCFDDPEFYVRQTPHPGAVELVDRLMKQGHHVMIYSAVPPRNMRYRASQILRHFPIEPGDIILGGNKALMAADVLLDDGLYNCLRSKCAHPVVFRQPWNTGQHDLTSVDTYDEFYLLVQAIIAARMAVSDSANSTVQ